MKWEVLDHKSPNGEELECLDFLNKRVIGQDRAKMAIVRNYIAWKHGVRNKNRPPGIFIFLGPSGVGKTSLVAALAEMIFDRSDAFLKVDCSTFQEKHDGARLLGAPPGYIGHDGEPELTQEKLDIHGAVKFGAEEKKTPKAPSKEEIAQKITGIKDRLRVKNDMLQDINSNINRQYNRLNFSVLSEKESAETVEYLATLAIKRRITQKDIVDLGDEFLRIIDGKDEPEKIEIRETMPPPSILLLDEFEKAHPEITKQFLPMFDTGIMPRANGKKIDFRNCFIFMTSNLGSDAVRRALEKEKGIGFVTSSSEPKKEEITSPKAIYRIVMREIRKSPVFTPEFLGRIGKKNIIVFHSLEREIINQIIQRRLLAIRAEINAYIPGVRISFKNELVEYIMGKAMDAENRTLGARPVETITTKEILEPLFSLAIKGEDGGVIARDEVIVTVSCAKEAGDEKEVIFLRNRNPDIGSDFPEEYRPKSDA
ncbi:MAG TPA: AAA family ATPase [Candidatus Paceibacterota bacterium]|nr:AAA family ATPase [Candidatus Paceibacterota bacterium]